jgi:hypothetical protein
MMRWRDGDALLPSMLLETELRRLSVRVELAQTAVTHLLDRFDLVETDRALYREAACSQAAICAASTPCTSRQPCASAPTPC